MTDITIVDVANEVIRLGREHPEFVYSAQDQTCLYVHEDFNGEVIPGTGCIFGRALQNLGIPANSLKRVTVGISSLLYNLQISENGRAPGEGVEGRRCHRRHRRAFIACQGAQDAGSTWGEAIEPLERLFER